MADINVNMTDLYSLMIMEMKEVGGVFIEGIIKCFEPLCLSVFRWNVISSIKYDYERLFAGAYTSGT